MSHLRVKVARLDEPENMDTVYIKEFDPNETVDSLYPKILNSNESQDALDIRQFLKLNM